MTQPPATCVGITVGFSTTNKWISRVIRWVMRSPCSHAWLAYDDPTLGMRLVMQAESWGYELRPWLRWRKENILVAEFVPTGPNLDESLKWIATFLGARYDYKAAILSGLWRWFGRAIRGKFNNPDKLMCSEGVVRFLQHANYRTVRNLDPETTNPKRLLIRCFRHAREFTLTFALPKVLKRYEERDSSC